MLWVIQIISIITVVALSPLFWGIGQTVKARAQGRHGPSPWQIYWVIAKSWRKETTVPEYSSFVFRVAPSVSLGALVALISMIPIAGRVPSLWPHDLLTVFLLLALERFWVALSGMDAAGTFGGLGASRVSTLGTGLEPALLAAFGVLWQVSGQTAIGPLAPSFLAMPLGWLPWALACLSFVLVMVAELGRLPADNPDTHLELTMIHEATVLEYTGRLWAQSQWAITLKYTALIMLGWVVLGPCLAAPWETVVLRMVEIGGTSVVLSWLETRFTKLRYFQLPQYLALASGIGMLAFYLVLGGFNR